ncbi:hypothetical protein EJ04DRAFT_547525 [Polyplosphaeria fusca]|uniref:N-acetyltransferase domain-containing protein n=1 Tax=Polyplosphaeria fusca TaxID=682080 RepID=A0A9P4QKY9_9PLEO|nr:hypothetical protein EJ04DRAFT_547525 [Polyplosphaeria fusca]
MVSAKQPSITNNAGYVVKQAHSKQEMDRIMDVIWAANYNPYEPFAQLFFPVLGFLPSDCDTARGESKERFWSQHQQNPSSNWYYVEETGTGEVVGCVQWEVNLKNMFPDGPPNLQAPWWPKGEYRELCEHIFNQAYKPRASWMARPHLACNWMAVHPSHRRRGVGSLLVQIGVSRSDELKVETWLEASSMGKPLYENFGFRSLFKIAFDTEKRDATDQWRRAEHEITPPPIFPMWRPKQGLWEEHIMGITKGVKMPWELATLQPDQVA